MSGATVYSYVNNNPLSRVDPSGFDDLDPITVIGTPIVDGAGDLFGAIGSFFGGLFGGGGPHLSAAQQAAQAHGINLSKSLPQYAGGSFQADAVNTFSVYQDVGASYGIDPNDVRLGVTPLAADPSVENEIDGATVTASRASPGDFNFAAIGRTPAFTVYNGAMNVAAGGVLGAPLLAAGVGILPFAGEGVEGAVTAEKIAVDANKLNHIFGNASHNLESLAQQLGSQENAFGAIQSATQAAVNSGGLTGVFETVVDVGGTQVTVRGAVVDGAVKIGTAFIP